jgi:hypothetical protein
MKKQKPNTYKPDWTPENAEDDPATAGKFAVRVVKGVESKIEVKKEK